MRIGPGAVLAAQRRVRVELVIASLLGRPDIGLLAVSEMVQAARRVVIFPAPGQPGAAEPAYQEPGSRPASRLDAGG